jgi:hypothetical protein
MSLLDCKIKQMGYFRFRRSFKILPGIRWNFGKRSSSVSLGGRGFHYTIGPHGNRTTVGLPGTGLSYTSVNRPHQRAVGNDGEMEKALAWAKTQDETFHLDVPDRESGEELATPDQLKTIYDLVHKIEGSGMANLGRKQASFLIEEIQKEKAQFTEKKVREYVAMQKPGSGSKTCGIVLFLIVLAVAFVIFISGHK